MGKRNGKREVDCGILVVMRMEFRLDATAWNGDGDRDGASRMCVEEDCVVSYHSQLIDDQMEVRFWNTPSLSEEAHVCLSASPACKCHVGVKRCAADEIEMTRKSDGVETTADVTFVRQMCKVAGGLRAAGW